MFSGIKTSTTEASENQIGTTYGLAYDTARKNFSPLSYMRRFAGFGPAGTGAIYKVANPGTGPRCGHVHADLNALFGAGTAGTGSSPVVSDRLVGRSTDRRRQPHLRHERK